MRRTTTELSSLYDHDGPFTSVYVPLPSDIQDARHQLEVRLRSVRRAVEEAGGDAGILDAADWSGGDHRLGATLAMIGAGSEVLVNLPLELDGDELTRVDSLPVVTPLLVAIQSAVPYVVVLTDRTGAEIIRHRPGPAPDEHSQVEGDTEHLTRVLGGGWSHRRMQQRAENTWDRNAAAVAEEVAEQVRADDARLVYAAGDERALGFLADHLPEDVAPRLHLADRQPQGLDDAMAAIEDDLRRQVKTVAARDQVEILEHFVEVRGRGEAVDGPADTLAALSESRVGTLLVHDDPGDDRRAWFAADSPVAALSREPLDDLGIETVEGRLVDVAVRSALLTDADIRVVQGAGPNAPDGALAGLPRWLDAA